MRLFNNKDILSSHPIDIFIFINNEYKDENWLEWETDTLLATILRKHLGTLSPEASEKILAIQALAENPELAHTDAIAFENIIHAFCNTPCIIDCVQQPYVEEIFYTVNQIRKILSKDLIIEFSGEIPGYVAAVAAYYGWFLLPHLLEFAQEALFCLTHMQPGTQKYNENIQIITAGKALINQLKQNHKIKLDTINPESSAAQFINKVVGAYYYDPTLVI